MVRWDVICFVGAKSIYDSSCKGFWGGECPLCLESLRDSTAGHGCLALSEAEITSPWLHGSRGKRVLKSSADVKHRQPLAASDSTELEWLMLGHRLQAPPRGDLRCAP